MTSNNDAEILWHYTDVHGLLGITAGTLWLTDAYYLNDTREILEGLEVAKGVLQSVDETDADSPLEELFRGILFGRGTPRVEAPTEGTYVASFCRDGDLLSQWRNYAGGGGYAIGFDREALTSQAEKWGGTLIQVEYGGADPRSLLTSGVIEGRTDGTFFVPAPSELARFKHPAFAEENEWRIVVPAKGDVPQRFRAGAFGLTPYIDLGLSSEPSLIREVRLGPGANDPHGERALTSLLVSRGHRSATVGKSGAPYRG